jgi:hypothetical protein
MQNINLPPSSMRALEVALLFTIEKFGAKALAKAMQLWIHLTEQDFFAGWRADVATFVALSARHTADLLRDPGNLDVYTVLPLVLSIRRLAVRGLLAAELLGECVQAADDAGVRFAGLQPGTLTQGQKREFVKMMKAVQDLKRRAGWDVGVGSMMEESSYDFASEQFLYGHVVRGYPQVREHAGEWLEGTPQGWEFGHGAEGEWVQEQHISSEHAGHSGGAYPGAEGVVPEDAWHSQSESPVSVFLICWFC